MSAVPAARAMQALTVAKAKGHAEFVAALGKAWNYAGFRRVDWLFLAFLESPQDLTGKGWDELPNEIRGRLIFFAGVMIDLFTAVGRGSEANGKVSKT